MGEMADDLIEQGFLQKALHDSGGDCGYGCPYCEEEYQAECRRQLAEAAKEQSDG